MLPQIKEVKYFEWDSSDYDRIANNYFGKTDGINFVADEEAENDSEYSFKDIIKKEYERDKRIINRMENDIIENHFPMFSTRTILLILVQHDVIPEGDYLIKVSW